MANTDNNTEVSKQMKIAYYFVFLVLATNIASGIVASWIGDYTGGDMGGLTGYNKTHDGPFLDEAFEGKMSIAGSISTAGSTTDTTSLLDLLGLGFLQTWIKTTADYLYGIGGLLYAVFGPFMSSAQLDTWFGCSTAVNCFDHANGPNTGIIGIILSSMWIIAAIGMFTGKSLFQD